MEWLFTHTEDPSASAAPAPAAAEPAKDVAQQLKLAPAQVPLRLCTTRPSASSSLPLISASFHVLQS